MIRTELSFKWLNKGAKSWQTSRQAQHWLRIMGNCLFFAIRKAIKEDKYVVMRKSRHDHKWPIGRVHFLVVPKWIIDEYAESFCPTADDLGSFPCPLFKGEVKKGD